MRVLFIFDKRVQEFEEAFESGDGVDHLKGFFLCASYFAHEAAAEGYDPVGDLDHCNDRSCNCECFSHCIRNDITMIADQGTGVCSIVKRNELRGG